MIYKKTLQLTVLYALLVFSATKTNAQIIDTTMLTGYEHFRATSKMSLYHDSLAVVVFDEKVAGTPFEKQRVNVYRCSDLSLKSSFYLNTQTTKNTSWHSVSSLDLDRNYIFTSISYSDSSIIKLTRFYDGLDSIQSSLTKKVVDFQAITGGIIDNELYIMFKKSSPVPDTTLMMATDLNLNTLRTSLDYWGKDGVYHIDSMLNIFLHGPFQHPNKANRIVYGHAYSCVVLEIDKQSLEVEKYMPRMVGSPKFASPTLVNYHFYPDRVVAGGVVGYFLPPITSANTVKQSYLVSRDWNGNLLLQERLGDTTKAECSYAYSYNLSNETHFLGGSTPCTVPFGPDTEYRKIKIHRYNKWGHDTILFYGDKNNITRNIEASKNGDLFLLSTYTNAWTDGASFVLLTKIPGFALTLIDNKTVQPKIHLYPNPAHDFLNISDFMGEVESLEIYDQSGKLLKTCALVEEPLIDIKDMPNGILVIVVSNQNGENYTSLVLKN